MSRCNVLRFLVSLMAVSLWAVSAQASSIGINLSSDDPNSTVSAALSDGYVAQTNWNNANMNAGCAFVSGPVDSAGAAVTSGLSIGLDLAWGGGWSYYYAAVNGGPANTLGASGWEAQYGPIIHVNNIPYATYDVAVLTGFYGFSDMKWEVETGKTGSSYTTPSYRNGGGGFYAIQIIAAGAPAVPQLNASPASGGTLNLGTVAPSATALSSVLTLSNIGDVGSTINVSAANFSGDAAALFGIDGGFSPAALAGGGAGANYTISFAGTATPGTYDAAVTFVDDLAGTADATYNLHVVVAAPLHAGDINGDGTVDLQDFGTMKDNFGATEGATWATGDLTGDGAVDLQDFGVLKDHFGHTNGDSPVNAVPEPATMSLLALAGLGVLRRKR